MKRIPALSLTFLLLAAAFGCGSDAQDPRVHELENENAQLQRKIASQDSIVTRIGVGAKFVNAYLDSLDNLESSLNEDLATKQNDSVVAGKVKSIVRLAHLNRSIVDDLRETLGKDNLAAKLLLDHVVRLDDRVKAQEMKIAHLNNALGKMGGELSAALAEYTTLQQEYKAQSADLGKYKTKVQSLETELTRKEQAILDKEAQMNRVFYFFGNKKELAAMGITKKSNMFSQELNENINLEALNEADIRTLKTLDVPSATVKLLSDHPASSYQLSPGTNKTRITINDPAKFWSLTKALIVQTN